MGSDCFNSFLLLDHNMKSMHLSKQYNENQGLRTNITCNFRPMTVIFPDTDSTYINLWGTVNIYCDLYEPRCEKTGLRGFRPGPTQTGLYSHRRWLEA